MHNESDLFLRPAPNSTLSPASPSTMTQSSASLATSVPAQNSTLSPASAALQDARMRVDDALEFTENLRIIQLAGPFPLINSTTISPREAAVLARYRMLYKFKFPKSGFSVKTYRRVPYTITEGRIRTNRRLYRP